MSRQKKRSPTGTSQRSVAARAVLGVRYGAVFSAITSVIGVVGWGLGGLGATHNGFTLGAVLLVYMTAGIVGGAVVGVMLPWANHPVVAAIGGMVVAMLLGIGSRVAEYGASGWTGEDAAVTLIYTAFFGIPAGLIARSIFGTSRRNR